MSEITDEVVEDLQSLSRIYLNSEERQELKKRLSTIIEHIDHLETLDTKNTPPCIRVQKQLQKTRLREDIGQNATNQYFLQNAPKHMGGMIQVPVVIEK